VKFTTHVKKLLVSRENGHGQYYRENVPPPAGLANYGANSMSRGSKSFEQMWHHHLNPICHINARDGSCLEDRLAARSIDGINWTQGCQYALRMQVLWKLHGCIDLVHTSKNYI
jgi:hypothetical protein